jgi:hypothetical protein
MFKNWMMVPTLLSAMVGTNLFAHVANAAPAEALGTEAEVMLEKTLPEATPEGEAADLSVSALKSTESSTIQQAPGFSERSTAIESLLKSPASVPPLTLPIPVENFIYQNGGIGTGAGAVNHQYFRSCFHENHGLLGGSNDRVLPAPVTATGDSGISPYLDPAAIARLESVSIKFRYAFNGSLSSSLKLYLTNLTTGKVQFIGTLRATNTRKNPCVIVRHDVTHYITEPGVYGLRLVMNNRRLRWFPRMTYELGSAPGDVVDLGGESSEIEVAPDSANTKGSIRPRPLPPIFYSPKAVAGFNHVTVTVARKN